MFGWQTDGRRLGKFQRRRCSLWKSQQCEARYTIYKDKSCKFKNEHNHEPIYKPGQKEEKEMAKAKTKIMLQGGGSVSKVHKAVVSEFGENAPTVSNTTNMQTQHRIQQEKSIPETFHRYSKKNLHIFASDECLALLEKAPVFFVDGTFGFGYDKLILTTVMIVYEDITIPCAYMLSKLRTEEVYAFFFAVIPLNRVSELIYSRH